MNSKTFDTKNVESVLQTWFEIVAGWKPEPGTVLLLSGEGSNIFCSTWPLINLQLIKNYNTFSKSYMALTSDGKKKFSHGPMSGWKISKQVACDIRKHIQLITVNDCLADSIVNIVDRIEDEACIVVPFSESYIWQQEEYFEPENSHVGLAKTLFTSSFVTFTSKRFFKLCRRLLELASDKKLYIILASDCPCALPEDLHNNPKLAAANLDILEAPLAKISRTTEILAKQQGFIAAEQYIDEQEISEENRSKLMILVHSSCGQYKEALDLSKIKTNPFDNINSAFAYVQLAHLAGDREAILEFSDYICKNIPNNFEMLKICFSLAQDYDIEDLYTKTADVAERLYPGNNMITEYKYNWAINTNQHQLALEYAISLNDNFRITCCNILSTETSKWISLLENSNNIYKERLILRFSPSLDRFFERISV